MLQELGYSILSTGGTGKHLKANGVDCEVVLKIQEGRPNIGDLVKNGDIAMMLITSTGITQSALAWLLVPLMMALEAVAYEHRRLMALRVCFWQEKFTEMCISSHT